MICEEHIQLRGEKSCEVTAGGGYRRVLVSPEGHVPGVAGTEVVNRDDERHGIRALSEKHAHPLAAPAVTRAGRSPADGADEGALDRESHLCTPTNAGNSGDLA